MKVFLACRLYLTKSQTFPSFCWGTRNLCCSYACMQKSTGQRIMNFCTRLHTIKLQNAQFQKMWSISRSYVAISVLLYGKQTKDEIFAKRLGVNNTDFIQIKRHYSKDQKKENILTVPNLLCMVRIALAPTMSYLLIHSENLAALAVLFVAGMTDLLDGFIARNFRHQSSVFGSMLDPAADKILMTFMTVSLTWVNLLPVYLCALIVGRDIGIMSAVAYLRYKTVSKPLTLSKFFDVNVPTVQMKPTFISKVNTGLQLGLVGLCTAAPVFDFTDSSLLHAYWYFVGTTTVLSGLSYVIKGSETFKVLK